MIKLKSLLIEIGEGSAQPFKYRQIYASDSMEMYEIAGLTSKNEKVPIELNFSLVKVNEDSDVKYKKAVLDEFPGQDLVNVVNVDFAHKKSRSGAFLKKVGFSNPEKEDRKAGNTLRTVNDKQYMFRLMATIKNILSEYIRRVEPDCVAYMPMGEVKRGKMTLQRDLLYTSFIKKVFPNAKPIYTPTMTIFKIK